MPQRLGRRSSVAATTALLTLCDSGLLAAALQPRQASDAEAAAACASCAGCSGIFLLVPILYFALNIALLVWVARDAKARGMDSAVLWMILVMVTSVVGLLIYVLSRPKGNLVKCAHCGNSRLQASAKCPHCSNA